MAFRRFGRRRSYRRYPRRGYRKNFRRGYRRNYRTRRPRRGNYRRRNWISPYNKKYDTLRSAQNSNDNSYGTIDAPNSFFAFCPTYRSLLSPTKTLENRTFTRESSKIGFTGYKERCLVATGVSLIWRRIVVWSYQTFNPAKPPIKGSNDSTWYGRQTTPVENTLEFRSWLFRGTEGTDYTRASTHEAPLETKNFTVSYDKTRWLNPTHENDFGYQKEFTFWHPGGKIVYDDEEIGSAKIPGQGWSAPTRESRGNMYVIDIFNSGLGLTSDLGNIARFAPQGTAYWVEG